MSFNELVIAAQALPPEEKQQLMNILEADDAMPEGIPPEFFLPGAVIYPGSQITTDAEGWKVILEVTGIGEPG
ncbi:MAG TPA: hypothetical protein VN641_09810 [Urbifossiella sp.]|nr:hypothetical protein [Urbifossiella sp.]